MKIRLDLQTINCDNVSEFINRPYVSFNNLCVLFFSLLSVILTVRYFLEIAKVYKDIRIKYVQKEKEIRSKSEAYVSFLNFITIYHLDTKLPQN